jgi:hypothetical protein
MARLDGKVGWQRWHGVVGTRLETPKSPLALAVGAGAAMRRKFDSAIRYRQP